MRHLRRGHTGEADGGGRLAFGIDGIRPMESEPFHLAKVDGIAGEAEDGGVEEGVSAEFAGDAVQEGEAGRAVVSGTAVQGDGFPGIILLVPAAPMDLCISMHLFIGPHQIFVLADHSVDKSADERFLGVRYEDKLGKHASTWFSRQMYG